MNLSNHRCVSGRFLYSSSDGFSATAGGFVGFGSVFWAGLRQAQPVPNISAQTTPHTMTFLPLFLRLLQVLYMSFCIIFYVTFFVRQRQVASAQNLHPLIQQGKGAKMLSGD
jgi:hypothetical protein